MTIGDILSHYRVQSLLGAGGMGEVYKAEDLRLKRAVALKVLPLALLEDPEAKQRLMLEAQAVSALDHPNICTIHEIDETADGRLFLAMAYYSGETLRQRIARGSVAINEAVDIAIQITRGVATAHAAGIIHRDIKPANIFLCDRPNATDPARESTNRIAGDDSARVKLLDFGIAKLSGQTVLTRTGTTIGTVAYMAPEHLAGHAIDERADIWSIGVVLYELLSGRQPFSGTHELATMRVIADEDPTPLRQLRSEVSPSLEAVVERALQKDPKQRYASALDLLGDLELVRDALRPAGQAVTGVQSVPPVRSRRVVWAALAAMVLVAAVGALWYAARVQRENELRRTADEISKLIADESYEVALRRLYSIPPDLAGDPVFEELRTKYFMPLNLDSAPDGADVYFKEYMNPEGDWVRLGRTPIQTAGTIGAYRWKVTRDGFETFEGSAPFPNAMGRGRFTLLPAGTTPPGMVSIAGGPVSGSARLPPFAIDRFEVTNKEFKQFVDAGGYRRAEFWQEPFTRNKQVVDWKTAVADFIDSTGRPGPATWELGSYPAGQDDFPVGGVSWYEAMAYARYAGKSLPTVYHWQAAAAFGLRSDILLLSNFSGKGPAAVGSYQGIGPVGTYDMAGNVKEWCFNSIDDRRYILGGAWNEPNYQYRQFDARSPFDRSANNGLRLVKLRQLDDVPAAALEPVARVGRDYSQERPVSDEVYSVLARTYEYDPANLNARIESRSETEDWRVERVSYAAAYGQERIIAYLFLPKNVSPPYQTVMYFPHSGGLVLDTFQEAEMAYLGFMVKSGRALLFPMYKGTYERRSAEAPGPNAVRERTIQQIKDVKRSVEYVITRTDLARDQLAFFGVSLGAALGTIALAVEPRFKAAVFWSGGLSSTPRPPEIDQINFAPRIRLPVLLLNGKDDFTNPVATAQEPLLRLLGTPAPDKKHVLFEGGHIFPFSRMIKDSLDWFDKYLGPPK